MNDLLFKHVVWFSGTEGSHGIQIVSKRKEAYTQILEIINDSINILFLRPIRTDCKTINALNWYLNAAGQEFYKQSFCYEYIEDNVIKTADIGSIVSDKVEIYL